MIRRNDFVSVSVWAAAAALLLLFAGCARFPNLPAGFVKEITGTSQAGMTPLEKAKARRAQKTPLSSIVEQETMIVPPLNEPPPPVDYVVGPNDSISVYVSGHPEYSPGSSAVGSGGASRGSRVDGSGNIQVPILGLVRVGGLTLPQIRERFQELLLNYLQEPSVVVEVSEYKSQPLYVLGQFKSTGIFYMDRPFNVLQGISLGGGYETGSANPRAARVIRDKKVLPIDIYELLMNADQAQNVWLKPGDTIFMPDNKNKVVLVFGAGKSGTAIPIPPTGINLLQAIAIAGLQEVGYHARRVYILRSFSPTRGQLMVVDVEKIMQGDALPLALAEGDVIYIPKSALTSWNEALNEMLPTFSALGAILQPFVQVRYLWQTK